MAIRTENVSEKTGAKIILFVHLHSMHYWEFKIILLMENN